MAASSSEPIPIEGIIFDLDGTLIDYEGASHIALAKPLERRGKALSWELHASIVGTKPEDWSSKILEACGIDQIAFQPPDYAAEYFQEVDSLYSSIPAWPGTLALLRSLRAAGFPLAIATSSPRASFEKKMIYHTEILTNMSAVVTGDEVERGKPAPDIFLEAARRLGCDPRKCIVFEDSPSGIAGAHAAGCLAVALPDSRMPGNAPKFDELAPKWRLDEGIGAFDAAWIRMVPPSGMKAMANAQAEAAYELHNAAAHGNAYHAANGNGNGHSPPTTAGELLRASATVLLRGKASCYALHRWSGGAFGELLLHDMAGSSVTSCDGQAGLTSREKGHFSAHSSDPTVVLLRLRAFEAFRLAFEVASPRLCIGDAAHSPFYAAADDAVATAATMETTPLGPSSCWAALCEGEPLLPELHAAYSALRLVGWHVRDGLKFGFDFALYDASAPVSRHAPFGGLVVANGSERSWLWLQRHARICHSVGKGLIVCSVAPAVVKQGTNAEQELPTQKVAYTMRVNGWDPGRAHAPSFRRQES